MDKEHVDLKRTKIWFKCLCMNRREVSSKGVLIVVWVHFVLIYMYNAYFRSILIQVNPYEFALRPIGFRQL